MKDGRIEIVLQLKVRNGVPVEVASRGVMAGVDAAGNEAQDVLAPKGVVLFALQAATMIANGSLDNVEQKLVQPAVAMPVARA